MSNSLRSHGLSSARLLSPWNSPDKNTGVSGYSLSPGDLPNLGIKLGSPILQVDSLPSKPPGKPHIGLVIYIYIHITQFSSLSHVRLFATPWTAACQDSLSITNSHSLLRLMSIKSVMPPNHFILCHPLLLLPSIFPSIRVFSKDSVLHIRWPKYWIFSFSISLFNEYSGLISFRMDCLHFLAVQGTLKSLLQHHTSKASVLQRSAFFMVQLSYPHLTTGNTTALMRAVRR